MSQQTFVDSLDILRKAMAGGTFSHEGERRHVDNVAMVLEPFQKPHPPMWMGVHSAENVEFAARHGMNIVSLHSAPAIRDKFDHYRKTWREIHGPASPVGKAGLGLFVVVGETDAQAAELAARAYKAWHASFHYLYHLHGRAPVWGERPNDFQIVVDELRGVAGTPDKVARFIEARMAEANSDYLVCQFVFGDMSRAEALKSVEMFGSKVMPALGARAAA